MTTLTFTDAQAESICPTNSFVVIDNKLYCDVGTVIEESVTALTADKFAEFVFKLSRIGRNAQLTKNANGGSPLPVGQQVNSFDSPLFTSPTIASDGAIITQGSVTVRVKFSIDPNTALTNIV